MENTRKRSYYYVLTVFLGTFMMFLGTQSSAGFSIIVNSLKSTYNLTGTASSFIFTAKNICAFIFVMFANKYYEKLGLRVGIALSYVYGIIGLLILRISNGSLVLIYLAAVFIGAMYAFCMILPMALLIRTWFNKNRALCMAICSAGTGLSTYLLSPLLQKRIAAEGMNGAYNTLMIFFAAGAIVMFLLLRSKPSDVGLEIYGGEDYVEAGKKGIKKVALSQTNKTAVVAFIVCAGLMGFAAPPAQQHLVLHFNAVGFDSMFVAKCYAYVGLALLISKPLLGVLSTKVPFGLLSVIYLVLYIVSFLMAALLVHVSWVPMAACIIYGIAGPICSLGYTNWVADFSTKEDYSKKVKNAQLAYQGCEIVGSLIPGVIFDVTGSYGGFYIISAVFMVIIIAAVVRFYAARGKMVAAEA